MTMTTFQTILLTAIIAIWLVFSIVILIATIQNFLYDRRREKREQESTARDIEVPQGTRQAGSGTGRA
jgi:cell division protein FtsL